MSPEFMQILFTAFLWLCMSVGNFVVVTVFHAESAGIPIGLATGFILAIYHSHEMRLIKEKKEDLHD